MITAVVKYRLIRIAVISACLLCRKFAKRLLLLFLYTFWHLPLENLKFIPVRFTGSDTSCRNDHNDRDCKIWADYGHCQINPSYMSKMCKKACSLCEYGTREDTNEEPRDPIVDIDKEQKDGSIDANTTTRATTENIPRQGRLDRWITAKVYTVYLALKQ